jgi:hypothetical protein
MTLEEMLAGAKCSCGHLWIADHVLSGDKASCRLCSSCVLEMWDVVSSLEITREEYEELARRMKTGEV